MFLFSEFVVFENSSFRSRDIAVRHLTSLKMLTPALPVVPLPNIMYGRHRLHRSRRLNF